MVGDLIGALPAGLVLIVVAALVTAEAALLAGLVLPSATALVALGLLANEGVVRIGPAALVATGAAVLGGTGGYVAGRRRGPRARWVKERHWRRAERIFDRHGGRAVFFGQWVVGARTLVPRLAGMNGVPYRRFAAWHTPAAVGWTLWLVVGSYLAGASYDVLAARAGRAGGALAVLTALLIGLVLAGRWLGDHPPSAPAWLPHRLALDARPLNRKINGLVRGRLTPVLTSLGALVFLAALLVAVIPLIVQLSGLAATDEAVTDWARGQWTSDGYRFALELATSVSPEILLGAAAVVALVHAWWQRRDLLDSLAPLAPVAVLMLVLAVVSPPSWQGPPEAIFPSAAEYDGPMPLVVRGAGEALSEAGPALASMAAGQTALLAAVIGLLAWLLSRRLTWPRWVAVGTTAAAVLTVCAGSWVYLGWSRLSETIAALILGVAWAVLNAAIWATRGAAREPGRGAAREPGRGAAREPARKEGRGAAREPTREEGREPAVTTGPPSEARRLDRVP
ncbi:DedA family protein [Actinoplanes sp. Pm04-4]|uniref:DedA family protein n=1 Tax=Paractinoplanes pyxinae TaxID=2997416 RepID=A0ABT4ATW0_9ACTN|nr:DedA family protein [Actinoplanes pyxinae]MCY1137688.1 DedA family protein [Actinoplanes pyxinae]